MLRNLLFLIIVLSTTFATAQTVRVVDVPTRSGVTQRFLLLPAENAKATAILFAGGDGGIEISPDGGIKRGGNFLVRSRQIFVANGLAVAVIDTPSDRQNLDGFRQSAEHVADVKAAFAWLRQELKIPVWLIGTSRGTQSVAYIASRLAPAEGGADGIVLTSSVLADRRERPVPAMALDRINVPVLVTHHRQDSCRACLFSDLPRLTDKLKHLKKTDVMVFDGGISEGDVCVARAYHCYNGIETEVVGKIATWIKSN